MAKIFITGATGFTGRYVVRRLAEAGHRLTAFVRPESRREPVAGLVDAFTVGDLSDSDALRHAMDGHDILVNVASIGFGHAPDIVRAAERTGIKRAIYFSTTSLFTTLPAASKAVRQRAEDAIRASQTPWTIIRPTMIYGDPGDRNLIRLIRWVDRCPVVPVFGPGTFLLQPVHVDDLARAVPDILEREQTTGRAYNLSGGTALSYNELVRLVGELLGRRPRLLHLPVSVSLLAVELAQRLSRRITFSRENILRLNEHKAFPSDESAKNFGYAPRALRDGLAEEVRLFRRGEV